MREMSASSLDIMDMLLFCMYSVVRWWNRRCCMVVMWLLYRYSILSCLYMLMCCVTLVMFLLCSLRCVMCIRNFLMVLFCCMGCFVVLISIEIVVWWFVGGGVVLSVSLLVLLLVW